MHALFVQVVRLAQNMGLATLFCIAIDGTKFKVQTSKHKALTYENMIKAVDAISQTDAQRCKICRQIKDGLSLLPMSFPRSKVSFFVGEKSEIIEEILFTVWSQICVPWYQLHSP